MRKKDPESAAQKQRNEERASGDRRFFVFFKRVRKNFHFFHRPREPLYINGFSMEEFFKNFHRVEEFFHRSARRGDLHVLFL